jgi:hypothetical protein
MIVGIISYIDDIKEDYTGHMQILCILLKELEFMQITVFNSRNQSLEDTVGCICYCLFSRIE